MSIHITSIEQDVESLIKDFAENKIKLEGEAYYSVETGVSGLLIFSKEDPSVTIDIFVKDEPKKLEIGNDKT